MNSALVICIWILNIAIDTGGHLAFKAAALEPGDAGGLARWRHMLARPWLWVGIACFVIEFVVWLAFLSLIPLAVGVLLGMASIVAVMVGGRIWFRERFTRPRLVGVALIVVGVAIVGVA